MKVKIQDVKNPSVIKEVEKSLAGDFIGTSKFILYEEQEKSTKEQPKENKPKEEQENTNTSRFTMNKD